MIGLVFSTEKQDEFCFSEYLKECAAYNEVVEKERKIIETYGLLKTGKTPSENFNSNIFPQGIDYRSHIAEKLMRMICTLDITNQNIYRAYLTWEKLKNNHQTTEIYNSYCFSELRQMLIYTIHDIKWFVDQAISVIDFVEHGCAKHSIEVDCIGRYLNNKEGLKWIVCKELLSELNKIENSFKHSFSNDYQGLIGREELCIFTLENPHNKGAQIEYKYISVKDLTEWFNAFYKNFKEKLQSLLNQRPENS